jgi:CheY-like chemotaxis protein
MDKVLIVDDNLENLNNLREGLQKLNQFDVVTAADGEEAIEILERESISLLVTDIKMPKVDGLELLAYMTEKHSRTPCIVMTGYGTPEIKRQVDQQEVLQYIEKPFDFRKLAWAIIEGLHLLDEGGSMQGISLTSFVPLIEMTSKTCRLEVQSAGKGKGYFYFNEGVLTEAHYQKLRGERAALEMLSWDKMEVRFNMLPQGRAHRRIHKDLFTLLKEAVPDEPEPAPKELPSLDEDEPDDKSVSDADTDTATESEPSPLDRVIPAVQGPQPPPEARSREGEQSRPSVTKRQYSAALERHLDELKGIKGYVAIGILNFVGEVMAYDSQEDHLQFRSLSALFTDIFRNTHETVLNNGLGECMELAVHTSGKIVLMTSSGLSSKLRFYVFGIIDTTGNWYYMKMQLNDFAARIAKELG